jgi:TetR/AcrR family transcriptional regulator
LESYFQFLDDDPLFTRLLLWENVEKGKHIQKHQTLTKNPFLEQFRQIVEEGMSTGEFNRDLSVPLLLVHLIGLCFIYHSNQFSLSQALNLDLADPKVKAQGLDQVLRLVFEGITSRTQPTVSPSTAAPGSQSEGAATEASPGPEL